MPGAIDTNGVWQYAEDDEIPTLSAFMNKGQAAQSVAFNSVRSRVSALEAAAPVPVLTGRYTAGQTVASSSVIGTGTWTPVPGYSSTGYTTLWTPIVNGIQFRQKGIYLLTIQVKVTGGVSGRCFVDVGGGIAPIRLSWTSTGEDNTTLSTQITIPAAPSNVTLAMYQNSGASKAMTQTVDVVRIGAFS